MIENYNMNKDAFDFIYNAEADCYDLVVDKKNTESRRRAEGIAS